MEWLVAYSARPCRHSLICNSSELMNSIKIIQGYASSWYIHSFDLKRSWSAGSGLETMNEQMRDM